MRAIPREVVEHAVRHEGDVFGEVQAGCDDEHGEEEEEDGVCFARSSVSIGVFRRGLSITVKVRWTGGYAKGNGGWGKGVKTYSG